MAVTILGRRQPFRGLRRFNPATDLRQVAALITDTFAANLDAEGRAALRDMQRLRWLGPLLGFVMSADPQLRGMLNGYVWIEQDQVIGNLTLQSSMQYGGRWYISNVAVAPQYRGRGIAGSLMEAALDEVRHRGGGWVVLQAEAGNEAARRLYAGLDFTALGGLACLHHPGVPPLRPDTPSSRLLRSWRPQDWHEEYQLARAAIPKLMQWWQTVRTHDFRLYPEDRLRERFDRLVGRRRTYRWVVERQSIEGKGLVASLRVQATRWRGEHQLRLIVHPDSRGLWEDALLRQAMKTLASYPSWPAATRHPADHDQAVEAFLDHGFLLRRTLVAMRRRI
jgi:ribosomal protein S18 acetylase RimI-like enzyme